MSKQITISYKDVDYVLEYSKATIAQMESSDGFSISRIQDMPFTMIPAMFHGAFKLHHSLVSPALIDEIWDHISNTSEIMHALSAMIAEQAESLMPQDDRKVEENPTKVVLNFKI